MDSQRVTLLAALFFLAACANRSEPRELAPREVELRGELAASRTVALNAPFDGTIRKVGVREGQAVHAGDVLLELSNAEVERNLAVARTEREYAERRLAATRETPHVAASDNSGIAAAAAIVERKKAKRDRYRALFQTRDVTLQDLENAEDEYSAAVRDLANLRNAQQAPSAATSPRLAEIEVEKAKADEALAQARLQSLQIRAPIDGVVTRLDAVEGRDVSGHDALAEVTALGSLDARAEVDPDLLRVVRAGMPVEVKLMTVPPRVVLDKIAYVVPFRSGQQQGERRSVVVVHITNPDGALQPGTPAVLTVRTQT
jgi:multidrug resistance efflux pump